MVGTFFQCNIVLVSVHLEIIANFGQFLSTFIGLSVLFARAIFWGLSSFCSLCHHFTFMGIVLQDAAVRSSASTVTVSALIPSAHCFHIICVAGLTSLGNVIKNVIFCLVRSFGLQL